MTFVKKLFLVIFVLLWSNAHVTTPQLPEDISICIVDFKFDGTSVKICEFGEGLESEFKGYDTLHGKNAAWSMIWQGLAAYNLPLWYVDNRITRQTGHRGLSTLATIGGHCMQTLNGLAQDQHFIKLAQNQHCIVALRSLSIPNAHLQSFKEQYPNVLLVGKATNYFVRNKLRTHTLFIGDNEFEHYRPVCKIYNKKNVLQLVPKIINEFDGDPLVIKPLNASRGQGVIITDKQSLEKTLKSIFDKKNKEVFYRNDPSYSYWLKDKNRQFMIEAYAPSKAIIVQDKPYDATMRIMFIASSLHNTITIKFLDAYWKLPTHPLNDEHATLNEKHKSHIMQGSISSALVDANDYETVKGLLNKALPIVYKKILSYN